MGIYVLIDTIDDIDRLYLQKLLDYRVQQCYRVYVKEKI